MRLAGVAMENALQALPERIVRGYVRLLQQPSFRSLIVRLPECPTGLISPLNSAITYKFPGFDGNGNLDGSPKANVHISFLLFKLRFKDGFRPVPFCSCSTVTNGDREAATFCDFGNTEEAVYNRERFGDKGQCDNLCSHIATCLTANIFSHLELPQAEFWSAAIVELDDDLEDNADDAIADAANADAANADAANAPDVANADAANAPDVPVANAPDHDAANAPGPDAAVADAIADAAKQSLLSSCVAFHPGGTNGKSTLRSQSSAAERECYSVFAHPTYGVGGGAESESVNTWGTLVEMPATRKFMCLAPCCKNSPFGCGHARVFKQFMECHGVLPHYQKRLEEKSGYRESPPNSSLTNPFINKSSRWLQDLEISDRMLLAVSERKNRLAKGTFIIPGPGPGEAEPLTESEDPALVSCTCDNVSVCDQVAQVFLCDRSVEVTLREHACDSCHYLWHADGLRQGLFRSNASKPVFYDIEMLYECLTSRDNGRLAGNHFYRDTCAKYRKATRIAELSSKEGSQAAGGTFAESESDSDGDGDTEDPRYPLSEYQRDIPPGMFSYRQFLQVMTDFKKCLNINWEKSFLCPYCPGGICKAVVADGVTMGLHKRDIYAMAVRLEELQETERQMKAFANIPDNVPILLQHQHPDSEASRVAKRVVIPKRIDRLTLLQISSQSFPPSRQSDRSFATTWAGACATGLVNDSPDSSDRKVFDSSKICFLASETPFPLLRRFVTQLRRLAFADSMATSSLSKLVWRPGGGRLIGPPFSRLKLISRSRIGSPCCES